MFLTIWLQYIDLKIIMLHIIIIKNKKISINNIIFDINNFRN